MTLLSASMRMGGGPVPVPPIDPPTAPPTTPPSTPPSTPSSSTSSGRFSGGFSSIFGSSLGCTIWVGGVLGMIFGVWRGGFGCRAVGGGGGGGGGSDVVEHEPSVRKGGGDYRRPSKLSTLDPAGGSGLQGSRPARRGAARAYGESLTAPSTGR